MDLEQKWLEEYKEANAQHRHQSSLMFGQLAVLFAVSGALINIPSSSRLRLISIPFIGLILTICLFFNFQRLADFSHASVRRAKELEQNLGFCLQSSSPQKRFFAAIGATRIIYLITGIFWFFLFIKGLLGAWLWNILA